MRINRLLVYLIMLICGIGLFFGGIQVYVNDKSKVVMSDAEIIERAHELGMVDFKENLKDQSTEETE